MGRNRAGQHWEGERDGPEATATRPIPGRDEQGLKVRVWIPNNRPCQRGGRGMIPQRMTLRDVGYCYII